MQRPCNDLNLSIMRAAYEFNNPSRFVNGWHAKNKLSSFLEIDGSEGLFIFFSKQIFLLGFIELNTGFFKYLNFTYAFYF